MTEACSFVCICVYKSIHSTYIHCTILPPTIFNMDETGLQMVQKPQKILARRGKHQVGGIVCAERGQTTTCVCCCSATGQYVPPLLIFKSKCMVDNLKDGAPPGTVFARQENGWMNSEIFCKRLQHFIDTVHPSQDNKVLLLLDGHVSHTKNLEAIKMARTAGVIMLSYNVKFPPTIAVIGCNPLCWLQALERHYMLLEITDHSRLL